MKYILAGLLALHAYESTSQKTGDTTLLQPVELTAVRAADGMPFAKFNLNRKEISKNNVGQDLPFILNQSPSVVVNSDAGNGVGYTGIRIRGTDASRINVTLNGIPYNDAESQGTFFVDMPDIASSANSIQVLRGAGTSTNGSGSFGGSINISTNDIIAKRNIEFNNSFGSYHTFKNTLIFNSGIFGKHFTVDTRFSNIRSDGYIDRSDSRLKSYYTSFAFLNKKNSLRLNIFSGKEKTYQAWNGVDEKTLQINRRYNSAGTEKAGEPYENETDNYVQSHYQLFYNKKLNKSWKANVAAFLTKGKGYYEQYKSAQMLSDYGLPDYNNGINEITETNLVRRLWLDNDFFGNIFSVQHDHLNRNLIVGGSWSKYKGKHYGEIISAEIQAAVPRNYKWYDLNADKTDIGIFGKWTEIISENWRTYTDLQIRAVKYNIYGFRNNPVLFQANNYLFFNPKAGITYSKNKTRAYFSFGRSTKEPNRDDFEAATNNIPRPEKLNDFELGMEKKGRKNTWEINLYYMLYHNQLSLSGKINDVGAYTRINVKKSYRAGIELQGRSIINKWLDISGNTSLSINKINDFTEYIDDYDNGGQQTKFYTKSNLSYSPSVISTAIIKFIPVKNAEIILTGKYISRQYLDNTSQRSRSLKPYYVQDLRTNYTIERNNVKLNFFIQLNNIFLRKYEANGYTFSYIYADKLNTENYYFPMAPFNVIAGLNIQFQ